MQRENLEEMLNEMTQEELESEVFLAGSLWTPKPDCIQHFSKTLFTNAELVDAFLQVTHHWYVDTTNDMFGWQDEVRVELLRCLKEEAGYDNGPTPYEWNVRPDQLIYADMKFTSEWIGPQGMFTKYQSKGICEFERRENLHARLLRPQPIGVTNVT